MTRRDTANVVLELLRRRAAMNGNAMGADGAPDVDDGTLARVASLVDWREVIACASAHFVLAALAPALPTASEKPRVPAEAAEFLAAITQSNRDRNRMLLSRLREVCQWLSGIGVAAVALKGAAFLAEDQTAAAEWRFMQDLDLLIPADDLDAAVAELSAHGYRSARSRYDPTVEAHYPPLVSPCGTFSIELHTRLFGQGDFGLSPAAIMHEAATVSLAGAEIRVPSPRHRLGHLLVHAQVHNRFYPAERLVLKDLLDLSMLVGRHGELASPAALDALFGADAPVHAATQALFATWQMWRADRVVPRTPAERWGGRAFTRLMRPRWRSWLATPADIVRLELYRVRQETGHLARRGRTLVDPEHLARTTFVWSAKQRQRLWG